MLEDFEDVNGMMIAKSVYVNQAARCRPFFDEGKTLLNSLTRFRRMNIRGLFFGYVYCSFCCSLILINIP